MHDRINEWADLPFYNPTKVLLNAQQQGFRHSLGARATLPPGIRGSERKSLVECLDASVFAHGISQVVPGRDVAIAQFEAQDYDFILRFGPPETPGYCPLQLKTLVSEDVDPSQTARKLLEDLKRYADSRDLVVAIKVDRPNLDPAAFTIPPLRTGELWFFGPCAATAARWYLCGDRLGAPQRVELNMPLPENRSGWAYDRDPRDMRRRITLR